MRCQESLPVGLNMRRRPDHPCRARAELLAFVQRGQCALGEAYLVVQSVNERMVDCLRLLHEWRDGRLHARVDGGRVGAAHDLGPCECVVLGNIDEFGDILRPMVVHVLHASSLVANACNGYWG